MHDLEEWAHSHLSACLDEFNAALRPSGTWCKLSDRANSVEGHTVSSSGRSMASRPTSATCRRHSSSAQTVCT